MIANSFLARIPSRLAILLLLGACESDESPRAVVSQTPGRAVIDAITLGDLGDAVTPQDERSESLTSEVDRGMLRAVAVSRTGSVDDPATALTAVGDVLIGPQGWVYVAQPMLASLFILDEAGSRVRMIGGSGGGPGEFTSVGTLGLIADTVVAADWSRWNLFSLDGTFLSTKSWLPPPLAFEGVDCVAGQSGRRMLLRDGTVLVDPFYVVPRPTSQPPAGYTDGFVLRNLILRSAPPWQSVER